MEYQKVINLFDNANTQPSKFEGKLGWNEWLCMLNIHDPYILGKETKIIAGADAAIRQADVRNEQVTFKKFTPFTGYMQPCRHIS